MPGLIVFPFAQKPIGRDARPRVRPRPLAPRVAPAAVRVPNPRHVQVEIPFPAGQPQIFVHEGARQLLERRLTFAAQKVVLLSVTDNCRGMIVIAERKGVIHARLHHMFLDAPPTVQTALVRYIARGNREASVVVGRYIEQNNHRIRAAQPFLRPLITQGQSHDLLGIFAALNNKYFGGTVDALVTWGRVGRGRTADTLPRTSIKLGSYSAVERLIRVHPVLDRPWVPRYFVSYVLYHEMLHHVIPPVTESRTRTKLHSRTGQSRRRTLHPPHFLARERFFRDYERALAWEHAHIRRLLRARV